MKTLLCICGLLCINGALFAQPYVDPFQVRYTNAFRGSNNSQGTPYTHLWVGSDLPIKLKEKTYLLFSPFYENWQIDSASTKNVVPTVHGLVLPVGLLLPLKNEKWMLNITPIIRWNGEKLFGEKTLQFGGVSFLSYEKKPGKKIRFGAYVNGDFWGLFFMPLLGADWRIDDKNYIFGLLPGRITYEHKFNNKLYGGSTFRAITNSYRLANGQFVRVDDNQLSVYMDAYVSKNICFTLEPGYGIMRKLRTGTTDKNYLTSKNWGDGFFIKLSGAYRIRL